MDFESFVRDYCNPHNFDEIMETKNISAGIDYLLLRASTIKEMQILSMIKHELKKEVIKNDGY